ncbi:MAG TPA: DUF1376 domain-containing protein [Roseateles sp.]|uniref:DUF1376 domain-containing protein n=1 Tax=Roseateles sp. TaxID=1971397 RepID=UPI002EDAC937
MTPANCDLQDFPFMPLDVARLRDSELASNETPEACWAAVLLWAASWHQIPAASMPNDDKWIAKTAGYALRGKIDRAWSGVRAGAMRGFVECSDGRLYHPVVAEKAREAWQAKLRQRWSTECGRIKKHNERHEGANVPKPNFEEWIAGGCVTGNPLFVPGDTGGTGGGHPGETPSKRQGEGQGQGQGQPSSAPDGAADPSAVDKSLNAEERRKLWADAGTWLVANGQTTGDAKAFMNTVAKDFPAVVAEAFREAIKTEAPVDPKAFVLGVAKRLAGQRSAPITQPSDAAAKTAAVVAAEKASWTPEAREAADTARRQAMEREQERRRLAAEGATT